MKPVKLRPAIQRYPWGNGSWMARALGIPQDGAAEAWFGAHPDAPATAELASGDTALDALVEGTPEAILGPDVETRYGALPYLMKVLAARRPLSIQVHPDAVQAAHGFAREESTRRRGGADRLYRDPNPKPELIVALTDLYALCGFRPASEIAGCLEKIPEIADLLPPWRPAPNGLRSLVGAYLELPPEVLHPAQMAMLDRMRRRPPTPDGPLDPVDWLLDATRGDGPPPVADRGWLFVFLLDLVHLRPGEGMYLAPRIPHAYLRGAGVEIMASSDNVIRCGLTTKHVDPGELMRIVDFDAVRPRRLDPRPDGTHQVRYDIPTTAFALCTSALDPASPPWRGQAEGPDTILHLGDGTRARVTLDCEGHTLILAPGEAALVPHGLRYSLRADGPTRVFRATVPGGAPPTFRGRVPTALAFGTSGLRGRVEDITDLEAHVNTQGFLAWASTAGRIDDGDPVVVAGDLRPSTHGPDRSILSAVVGAIRGAGHEVVHCGPIPTPALVAYATSRGWASVMVTGSHIPFDRNGLKFHTPTGEILKTDEADILAAVCASRRSVYAVPPGDSPFDDAGMRRIGARAPVPEVTQDAANAYLSRYVDAFGPDALAGLRLVWYAHTAVGRDTIPAILEALGATVTEVGRRESFVAIDTEALSDDTLDEIRALTNQVGGWVDAVVSTDGDSDRPLVLCPDPTGRLHFVPGDVLGVLTAEVLAADAIAVPVSASDLVDRCFGPRGIRPVRTRIGSPWVIAALDGLTGARRVGWEANGGFLTASAIPCGAGILPPLPTRDALLPIVAVLGGVRRTGTPLHGRIASLPRRICRAGLLDAVPLRISRALITRWSPRDPRITEVRFDEGPVHWVDVHGDVHPADTDTDRGLQTLRDLVSADLAPVEGFGTVVRINVVDGVRIRAAGGDVAHVRPSGNAPQLRIYAVAGSADRADAIVSAFLRPVDGILHRWVATARTAARTARLQDAIAHTEALFASGDPAAVVGIVSGSEGTRRFWQHHLDASAAHLGARRRVSLHEDLPVNQALGLLLLWQRIAGFLDPGEGALIAFVFGEGSRATPFTEAENGQKAAMRAPVPVDGGPPATMVALALRYFAPVEAFLRRSGFDGIVVKWGDEIQIPARDLSGSDPRFAEADVVRFVSLRRITASDAENKDWIGVAPDGRITRFIPRRPLPQMETLADRGWLQRRGDGVYGGVNLGSIALSRRLLDALLADFADEIADRGADRRDRPDLDPQLFTALIHAAMDDPDARDRSWDQAVAESPAIATLEQKMPGIVDRLRRILDALEAEDGRPVSIVALDFEDQYWGDIGAHAAIRDFYMALADDGPTGQIARAMARVPGVRDPHGNIIVGDTVVAEGVDVRGSVLIDAHLLGSGTVVDSVLVGTCAGTIASRSAFDVGSIAVDLTLGRGAGTYRLVEASPVVVGAQERATTVFLPEGPVHLRCHAETDLRDRTQHYDRPVFDNPISFRDAHAIASADDPQQMSDRREARERAVGRMIRRETSS